MDGSNKTVKFATSNYGTLRIRGEIGIGPNRLHFGRNWQVIVIGCDRIQIMPSLSKQGWKKYKAGHPCNQFLLDKFTALKRSADIQKLENQASCYRKIISSIDKYPLPIVCI